MKVRVGELLDRISIETRKQLYTQIDQALMVEHREELLTRMNDVRQLSDVDLMHFLLDVLTIGIANSEIANLEWQIRESHELPLSEVGARALQIRGLNHLRVNSKNLISRSLGEAIESKFYGYGEKIDVRFAGLKSVQPLPQAGADAQAAPLPADAQKRDD